MRLSFSLPPRTPPTCTAARARSGPALLLSSAFSARLVRRLCRSVLSACFSLRWLPFLRVRCCSFFLSLLLAFCFFVAAALLLFSRVPLPLLFAAVSLWRRARACILPSVVGRSGRIDAPVRHAKAASPYVLPPTNAQRHRHHIASHAARICRCSAHFTISRCKHPRRCSLSSAASPHNAQSARAVPPFSSPSLPLWVLLLGRVVCCFVVPG